MKVIDHIERQRAREHLGDAIMEMLDAQYSWEQIIARIVYIRDHYCHKPTKEHHD